MGAPPSEAACECDTSCNPDCAPSLSDEAGSTAPKLALGSSATTVTVCAACCVLPLAWPAVGLVLTGSTIAMLEASQPWLTAISLGLVIAAWALVYRQAATSGKRTNPATLAMMAAATIFLAVALSWRLIEPGLVTMLGGEAQA